MSVVVASALGLGVILTVVLLVWQPWNGDVSSEGAVDSTTTVTEPDDTTTVTQPEDTDDPVDDTLPPDQLAVTTIDDDGPGSLRQAILDANSAAGTALITFDAEAGPFADPQVITLASPLPEITGEVELDGYIPDRLWVPTGVTLSGANQFRVLTIADGAKLTVRSLTVADGAADAGGGILNRGTLVVTGVTLMDNVADGSGGAVASDGGEATIINSTFVGNQAVTGGGLANLGGRATVINSTLSDNSADRGGALFNEAEILVSNTILANSATGGDCISTGGFDAASTNNLIEENDGCGDPINTDDPNLEPLDYYNGPAQTLPLRSGSPAINLGDNDAAVDENGVTLTWDQRGNGDPRFVAGYTDIGAFEHQAFPDFTVDTVDDVPLRGCTKSGRGDCPLRAAIELANATPEADVIFFDPNVFAEPMTITFTMPLPEVTSDLTLDASEVGPVTLEGDDGLRAAPGADLQLVNVEVR